jgi:hypothetical protein
MKIYHKIGKLLVALVCLAMIMPALNCTPQKSLELKLEKAPLLNEPVTLTCIRQTSDLVPTEQEQKVNDNTLQGNGGFAPPKHEKITLEFERVDPKTRLLIKVPAQEVLVSGNLNWEGNITGQPMDFSATLKFPYEGNWGIYARSTERPQDKDDIFLNIAKDSSSFGWITDYAPPVVPYPETPNEQEPITVEFDIIKPPRLNEPFQIIWGISTIRDIDEASAQVDFIIMNGTQQVSVNKEKLLVNGDVSWKGSLKKDNPLKFSATANLPEEGDWVIRAWCSSNTEANLLPITAGTGLSIHVEKDKSRWGWTKSHENPYKGPPPPPTSLPQ